MSDDYNLKPYIRTISNWPIDGVEFRDITSLIENPLAYRRMIDAFVYRYMGEKLDAIVGLDARGFILGGALSYALGVSFVPVRKKGKLPGDTISVSYALEYGEAEVEIHTNALEPGARVLIIDDLIATGGTLLAAAHLVRELKADIVEACAVIDLPDLKGSEKIREANIPLFTLVHFEGH